MLEARDLDFGYGGAPIGRNVNLSLQSGEALCVLGPNGAGKTTLFKTFLGLIAPIAGEIFLLGRGLPSFKRHEIAEALAYVPQAHAVFFPFTVADVVLMGRAARIGLFSTPRAADRAAAFDALAKLRIAHLAEKPYAQISGGERQLVLIARALAQGPLCLVMDEPMANLDLGNQARLIEEIAALRASGLSVLFSSHDPNHALICADRVALMHKGALIRVGAPQDVMTTDELHALYGTMLNVSFSKAAGRYVCAPVRGGKPEA